MQRLSELRHLKKMSQQKLSFEMNISQKMISAYERGKNEPSIEMLKRLATYFNTSVDYLIGFTEVKTPIDKILEGKMTAQEAEVLDNFRKLSHSDRLKVEGVLLGFLAK